MESKLKSDNVFGGSLIVVGRRGWGFGGGHDEEIERERERSREIKVSQKSGQTGVSSVLD